MAAVRMVSSMVGSSWLKKPKCSARSAALLDQSCGVGVSTRSPPSTPLPRSGFVRPPLSVITAGSVAGAVVEFGEEEVLPACRAGAQDLGVGHVVGDALHAERGGVEGLVAVTDHADQLVDGVFLAGRLQVELDRLARVGGDEGAGGAGRVDEGAHDRRVGVAELRGGEI